jgi:hypothetical protein
MAAVVTSLDPASAQIGALLNVTLHVHGTGFTPDAAINFNGGNEATTYVSATELTTVIDMSTAKVPGSYPVKVVQADGESNAMQFAFVAELFFVALAHACFERCPVLPDCVLPNPWPPAPVPSGG